MYMCNKIKIKTERKHFHLRTRRDKNFRFKIIQHILKTKCKEIHCKARESKTMESYF